jgi:hypothetical protein
MPGENLSNYDIFNIFVSNTNLPPEYFHLFIIPFEHPENNEPLLSTLKQSTLP